MSCFLDKIGWAKQRIHELGSNEVMYGSNGTHTMVCDASPVADPTFSLFGLSLIIMSIGCAGILAIYCRDEIKKVFS